MILIVAASIASLLSAYNLFALALPGIDDVPNPGVVMSDKGRE